MPNLTNNSSGHPDSKLAPPILLQRRSQLSLRALFFLQMQAAMVMLFITLAIGRQKATTPVLVSTFVTVTMLTCFVATLLSHHFAMRWWGAIGPATGAAVGLVASSLALSPSENFSPLMVTAFASSLFLIVLCVWQGRYLAQEESDCD